MIRRYLSAFIAAIVAAMGAMLYLRGRKDANDTHKLENAKAIMAAKENRHELESQDDQRLVDILTGKLRDNNR